MAGTSPPRRTVYSFGEGGLAVQAPFLGGGRGDLWWHHARRFAHSPDRLSEHRLSQRQGNPARLPRRHLRIRIRRPFARGARTPRTRVRVADSSAIYEGV